MVCLFSSVINPVSMDKGFMTRRKIPKCSLSKLFGSSLISVYCISIRNRTNGNLELGKQNMGLGITELDSMFVSKLGRYWFMLGKTET